VARWSSSEPTTSLPNSATRAASARTKRANKPDHVMHLILSIAKSTWSLIVAAWPAVGPLVGVVIGALLSRSWQQTQWLLEGKKTEYRELLNTLSQSYQLIVKNWPYPIPGGATITSGEQRREINEENYAGDRVIQDRIFIDSQMYANKVLDRWSDLACETNLSTTQRRWIELHHALVKAAHEDLGIKD